MAALQRDYDHYEAALWRTTSVFIHRRMGHDDHTDTGTCETGLSGSVVCLESHAQR